jgi:hypothetical protein
MAMSLVNISHVCTMLIVITRLELATYFILLNIKHLYIPYDVKSASIDKITLRLPQHVNFELVAHKT